MDVRVLYKHNTAIDQDVCERVWVDLSNGPRRSTMINVL